MEHINENTIRVVIRNEDLVARGITFLDLLGNHREIENFFYSILEEVDVEEEFQGSEAITFQVLPKGDGLELFISKNLGNEELEGMESGEQFRDEITNYLRSQMSQDEQLDKEEAVEDRNHFVFELMNFEDVIQLAKEVYLEGAWTNLYSFEEHYYLQISFLEALSQNEQKNLFAQLLEFGHAAAVTGDVLAEYGQLIMERNALELTRRYFA